MNRSTVAAVGHLPAGSAALRAQSGPVAPAARRSLEPAEIFSRMAIVAMFTVLAVRLGLDYASSGRMTVLLLLASEALVVVLTVFRRPTGIVDRSPRARLLTTVSLLGPMLVGPAAAAALVPELATALLSAAGLSVVIGGKLSLGRSFGLMPANRGIVSTGLYRLVRHPIYSALFLAEVCVILENFSWINLVLSMIFFALFVIKTLMEERFLREDPAYATYMETVRYRWIPGLL